MFENMDKLMAQAARQMALEKKKLIAKSKDGLTAGEVASLCSPGLFEALQDGSWYATGLRTPIDPDKQPERIPAYLWDVLEIDYTDNDASGGGLNYVRLRFYEGEYERRLTVAPAPRAADPLAGKADGASSGGRPTLKPEIDAAYKEVRDAGDINFDAPKIEFYELIREKVRGYKDDPNLQRGLGKETIRQVVSPLFEEDKNKHSASP